METVRCGLYFFIRELCRVELLGPNPADPARCPPLASMPKLKNIWSGDAQEILSFQNLIKILLGGCESLEHLLPFSVATRCSHLEELFIVGCENMKEIVAEKEFGVNVAPIFEFNQLSILYLKNLGKLEGFYAKKHTLVCPSLKKLGVYGCAKLNSYRTLSTRSSNFPDDNHQPSFIAEEVIPNLEMLIIDNIEASIILQAKNSIGLFTKMTHLALCDFKNENTFPYWFFQNAPSLQDLVVEKSCFEKIFQDEGQISEKTQTRLNRLHLIGLPKLQHICEEGSKVDPVLEFLQGLLVMDCSSLINLLPSSATLSHLEYLHVRDCNGLKNLFTSPTMRSLGKLVSLNVEYCNSLEEVITGEENIHITLNSLQKLVLARLPSLKQFCSKKCFLKFPLLEVLIVRECPRMKIFSEGYTSTPYLRKVKIAEDDEKFFWKGNINDTITSMFEDKEVLRSNTL